jgi:hypothetical protein
MSYAVQIRIRLAEAQIAENEQYNHNYTDNIKYVVSNHNLSPLRNFIPVGYSISLRACLARAAPIAVLTSFSSSGGGMTAGKPNDSIHNSRAQPVV